MKMLFISFEYGKFAVFVAHETIAVPEHRAWEREYLDANHMRVCYKKGELSVMTWMTFEVTAQGASAAREYLRERARQIGDDFEISASSNCDFPQEGGVPRKKADRFMRRVFGERTESEVGVTRAEALTDRRSSEPQPTFWDNLR